MKYMRSASLHYTFYCDYRFTKTKTTRHMRTDSKRCVSGCWHTPHLSWIRKWLLYRTLVSCSTLRHWAGITSRLFKHEQRNVSLHLSVHLCFLNYIRPECSSLPVSTFGSAFINRVLLQTKNNGSSHSFKKLSLVLYINKLTYQLFNYS